VFDNIMVDIAILILRRYYLTELFHLVFLALAYILTSIDDTRKFIKHGIIIKIIFPSLNYTVLKLKAMNNTFTIIIHYCICK